jgi:hypothetical protein
MQYPTPPREAETSCFRLLFYSGTCLTFARLLELESALRVGRGSVGKGLTP